MTVSEIFSTNCRGTVFDLPCPDSFVGVNRVIGNLLVEQDPVFGGGQFSVIGPQDKNFSLVIDDEKFSVQSAGDIALRASDTTKVRPRPLFLSLPTSQQTSSSPY